MGFAGAFVDLGCDGVKFFLRIAGEVRAFGEILADEAVRIFVGATLPGSVRVGEVDGEIEICCDIFVHRHFTTAIIGERLSHNFRHRFHLADKAPMHDGSGCVGELHEDQKARRSFDQSSHAAFVPLAFDEVAFPVSRHGAGFNVLRSHRDWSDGLQLSATVFSAHAGAAFLVRLTQMPG